MSSAATPNVELAHILPCNKCVLPFTGVEYLDI